MTRSLRTGPTNGSVLFAIAITSLIGLCSGRAVFLPTAWVNTKPMTAPPPPSSTALFWGLSVPRGGGNGSRSRAGGRPSDTFGIDEALHDRKPRSRSKASTKKRKGKGKNKNTSHRKRDGVRNRDDFDGNNDDDDDDDGNDDYRPRQRSSRPPPGYYEEDRYGYGPRRDRRPPPRPRRRQQGPGMLGTASKVAKKTVDLTTAATWTTLKGSGKAAFYLVSPKHVRRDEIFGVWRLDQQLEQSSGQRKRRNNRSKDDDGEEDRMVSCAANIELTPRGEVLVRYKDQVFTSTYFFKDRKWPQSCTIEFEARAFQGPTDEEPVVLRYKGYFRRKIADNSVIKMIGHMYVIPRKGRFGRRPSKSNTKVGTFVARRRLSRKKRSQRQGRVDRYDEDDKFEDDGDYEDGDDDFEDFDDVSDEDESDEGFGGVDDEDDGYDYDNEDDDY